MCEGRSVRIVKCSVCLITVNQIQYLTLKAKCSASPELITTNLATHNQTKSIQALSKPAYL